MHMKLKAILASETRRTRRPEHNGFVDYIAIPRISQNAQTCSPGEGTSPAIFAHTALDSGPERRSTAMADRPSGVAKANIVLCIRPNKPARSMMKQKSQAQETP